MLRVCILLICAQISQAWFFGKEPEWNDLKVTWGLNIFSAFTGLPRTEADAVKDGFTMISNCGDYHQFAGKRYIKGNDSAVVLLFDTNGYIAGLQAGLPISEANGYPHSPLWDHPFVLGEETEYITAYFVDPRDICSGGRTAEMFEESGTGTDLYIQNGTDPSQVVRIPKNEADLASTKWTKGKCFPTMGMHYWYNLREDMRCEEFFPVFLLYNKGKLNAFGWAFIADLQSSRYEHPPESSFAQFQNTVPSCLKEQGTISTMHIYLSSPFSNLCL